MLADCCDKETHRNVVRKTETLKIKAARDSATKRHSKAILDDSIFEARNFPLFHRDDGGSSGGGDEVSSVVVIDCMKTTQCQNSGSETGISRKNHTEFSRAGRRGIIFLRFELCCKMVLSGRR